MSVRSSRLSRASERGFSLIELGIVIAVIAVLASVVIVGRGFINSSRTGKAAEAISTIRKAGALVTVGMTRDSSSNEIGSMQARDQMPRNALDTGTGQAAQWTMTGSGTTAFVATSVMFAQINGGWAAGIAVRTPGNDSLMAEDLLKLVSADPNFLQNGGPLGNTGLSCQAAAGKPQSNTVTLCFKL